MGGAMNAAAPRLAAKKIEISHEGLLRGLDIVFSIHVVDFGNLSMK
jgi:hypothetical protein